MVGLACNRVKPPPRVLAHRAARAFGIMVARPARTASLAAGSNLPGLRTFEAPIPAVRRRLPLTRETVAGVMSERDDVVLGYLEPVLGRGVSMFVLLLGGLDIP
jgi:hypothetical protein